VTRLLRIPLVLAFAALWAAGSYALGYLILPDRLTFALIAAVVGGVVTGVVMGGLTSKAWPILLGIPLAIGAMTTSVYAAGIHHLETKPRLQVVVASEQCTQQHKARRSGNMSCDRHEYTFNDTSGKPLAYKSDLEDQQGDFQPVGKTLDVYLRDADTVKIWPVPVVEPKQGIRTAANILVPLFVGYVVLLGIVGAISRVASKRRFREHVDT
jgi:hypothetical protein